MTELHVICDPRSTWRVYEHGARAPLSKPNAADAERDALGAPTVATGTGSWCTTATTARTTQPSPARWLRARARSVPRPPARALLERLRQAQRTP